MNPDIWAAAGEELFKLLNKFFPDVVQREINKVNSEEANTDIAIDNAVDGLRDDKSSPKQQ